jgi:ribosomal protein L31E
MVCDQFKIQLQSVNSVSKPEIRAEVLKDFKDFVGTKEQINAEEVRLQKAFDNTVFFEREAYNVKISDIYRAFKWALAEEYGTKNEALNDLIYERSSRNKNDRLQVIEDRYASIAGLIDDVFATVNFKL